MSITLASPSSRPWRRFLRYSVRVLIVVVLLIGGWLGWIVRSARIQREAVAAIEDAGGGVAYDWEWNNGKSIPRGKPWAPRRIVDLIGVDYFGHVTKVYLAPSSAAHDALMAQVARLTRVQQLELTSRQVSDAGLVHLRGLSNLAELNLWGTPITDAGLVHLKGHTTLSKLWLGGAQITDVGLSHLTVLASLSESNLADTRVSETGLINLKKALPKLRIEDSF
jgi:internalin A